MAGTLDNRAERPFDETRVHRGAYRSLLRQLDDADLEGLADDVQEDVDASGCSFTDEARFTIDPVPRVIGGREWEALSAGLAQRVEALERFVADVYGEQEIVRAGVVPERVIRSSEHYDERLRGMPVRTWIPIAGLDMVRGSDGRFLVLEDNVRTPSGLAYLLAARDAVGRRVMLPAGARRRELSGLVEALRGALATAAPEGVEDPFAVLLSDGPDGAAFWEHETLARRLGVPLVSGGDLRREGDRLVLGRRPVDVVYRRTEDEGLSDLFERPLRAGTLAVVNAFGAGVADDKLVHAYVEEMVRFYLGEEPLLPSVRTYDLSDDAVRATALARLDRLVVKPRSGHGGRGVVIGPLADEDTLAVTRRAVLADPGRWIAQDVVMLSEHPTVSDGELEPRHVDLRPFVISGISRSVVPGGLTRVALDEGEMIVNSSRNGGAKDTWVLD